MSSSTAAAWTVGGPTQLNGTVNVTGTTSITDETYISNKKLKSVATSAAYADLIGAPALSKVATSNAYTDLDGKPVLKTVATSALYTDLTAQPTKLSQFTNDVSASGSNSFAIAGASPWLQFQGTGASYYQIGQASSAGAWSSYAAAGDLVIRGLGSNSIWLQQGTGGYGLCVNYNNIVYVQKPISVVNVWTTLPLQNGASAYGSGYQFPSYCMDCAGTIRLKGLIALNGIGFNTNFAYVPGSYCPKAHLIFSGNSNSSMADLRVYTTGNICITAGSCTNWISLDSCSWRTDQ